MDQALAPAAKPKRGLLAAIVVPIVGLIIAGNIGGFSSAALIKDNPLLLVTLSPLLRWQVATVPETVWWSWAAVCFVRLLVADPLFFLLGRFYGDSALAAVSRNVPSLGRTVAQIEKLFHKARVPVVFVAPNNAVCLLAGADRMNLARFMAANVAGTVTRLALVRSFAPFFEDQIRGFNSFLDRYKLWIVPLSIALFVVSTLVDRRKGGGGGGYRKMSEELSGTDPAAAEVDAG